MKKVISILLLLECNSLKLFISFFQLYSTNCSISIQNYTNNFIVSIYISDKIVLYNKLVSIQSIVILKLIKSNLSYQHL